VVLADGSTKPIKDIQVGDQVKATDPDSGANAPKTVTVLHDNQDTDLTDVTVTNPDGTVGLLATTQHHPFWDAATGAWVLAKDLTPGHQLHTPDGDTVTVTQVVNRDVTATGGTNMRDLTVADIHTYYVIAGNQPVLVHNCGGSVQGHPSTCACATGGVPQVRNGALAGSAHPVTGVPFDSDGFPDFSAARHPSVSDVRITLSGSRSTDFARANRAAGLASTPTGYTWHHHQDKGLMQLIDRTVHAKTGHTGGFK
jgi:hypothetical protein